MRAAFILLALVSFVNAATLNLSWQDNSTNETAFEVERSIDGRTWQQIANLRANSSSFSDVTAVAGNTYFYRLRSVNAAGASEWSNTASSTARPDGVRINVNSLRVDTLKIQ